MKRIAMIIPACLMVSSLAAGQTIESSVAELVSDNWTISARAFQRLSRTPGAWERAEVAAGLLRAYDRANRTVAETFRKSGGKLGVSDVYGEEFGEHLSQLFNTCRRVCERQALLDQMLGETVPGSILRRHTYELLGAYGVSTFSIEQRLLIDSAFTVGARDPEWPVRDAALRSIGTFVRTDPALTPARRAVLRQAVVRAAADPQLQVRMTAARRLADLGGPEELVLLRQMADSDQLQVMRQGRTVFPVRELATSELARIRKP
jgi:hypothetical protein